MKKYIVLLFMSGLMSTVFGQKREIIKSLAYKSSTYDVIVLPSGGVDKYHFSFFENKRSIPDNKVFMSDTTSFTITASIVDSSCSPLGLYVNDGKILKNINLDSTGRGNFYSLENGVFVFTNDNRFLVDRSKVFKYNSSMKFAIQTGPILVWNSTINSAFGANSQNLSFRCGVGIFYKEGKEYAVFVKSNNPVNFYEFSSFLVDQFKCNKALTLAGGDHSAMHLPGNGVYFGSESIICRYIKISFED